MEKNSNYPTRLSGPRIHAVSTGNISHSSSAAQHRRLRGERDRQRWERSGGSPGNTRSGKSHRQPESGRRLPVKRKSSRQSKVTRRRSLGRTGRRGENSVTATELKLGTGGEAGRPL